MSLTKPVIFETTFTSFSGTDIIGEGGSGRVYRAIDDTKKEFAIKLLHHSKSSKEITKRFKNEIMFCLKNQHKNIITVIDYGTFIDDEKRSPFYIMPLYDGSLRSLLEKSIPADKVLTYFAQILDGVEAAHLQHVVHRDLKPENIIYDKKMDHMLIADFGTARFEEETLYTSVETSPNTRLANFQYAAPEQRNRGAEVDHRADIYALGLILNEMFTGKVPHGTGYKTIKSVSPEFVYLDDIVTEMLHQSAAERPETIEKIKQLLIGKKNEFVAEQRLSMLKKTVVPVSDLDDPLVDDPPHLVNFDYDQGMLTLILQRSINLEWIQALRNMGPHTFLVGKSPHNFTFNGERASIPAKEQEVQQIINYFKDWLPKANLKYEETLRTRLKESEERKRQILQKEMEEQERRKRILETVKI